jgi:hypothetical protein
MSQAVREKRREGKESGTGEKQAQEEAEDSKQRTASRGQQAASIAF